MTLISRAAVFEAPGQPLKLTGFAVPEPVEGEVVARIRCTTICGSDLHTCFGRRVSPAPSVLGHEMAAEIAVLGKGGVRDFRGVPLHTGDRITWSMVWSCGVCYYCGIGMRAKCERLFKFGHERTGEGRDLSGGYAQYCLLPAGTAIFRVPDDVPDTVASPANCATATVAAVMRNAGPVEGSTVVVYGTGMLGLTACAMAEAGGAGRVMAIENDAARRELSRRFGASVVLDGGEAGAVREAVRECTGGRGADVVLEFAGHPEAVENSVDLLRFGGRLVMAGAVFPSRKLQLRGEQLVRHMLRLTGVYNYEPEDLENALRFLGANGGRFPFELLVPRRFPLDEINDAVAFAEREKPPRAAIIPFPDREKL